jgi:hypothetical protein
LNPSYSSLHYVLLFPLGKDGWHKDIPAHHGAGGARRAPNVSQRCYYAYRLHPKPGEQPLLFWGGNLLQQYVADAWAAIEENYLNWIKFHQKELRAEVYSGLRDAAMGDRDENLNLEDHGSHIILPATHMGSERYINQLFQDSMAICRAFNKPDIFLTMTANPNWPEIQDALLEGDPPQPGSTACRLKQTGSDRPDIIAYVFEPKKNALLKRLMVASLAKQWQISIPSSSKREAFHICTPLHFWILQTEFIALNMSIPSYQLGFLIPSPSLCCIKL